MASVIYLPGMAVLVEHLALHDLEEMDLVGMSVVAVSELGCWGQHQLQMPNTLNSCAVFVDIVNILMICLYFGNPQWLVSIDYFHPASFEFAPD